MFVGFCSGGSIGFLSRLGTCTVGCAERLV